ncbi:amidohydrolase family protein [Pseudonocardia humida]|uniref:Amidohydrolase n=1 Tax=Pseudonocardia humida TaxID=2800819 RepID=A0ABT1A311_9PSEU|nr:amidohydrolase family protein [Pseudonocardia humida]MCO1657333.1 amidohydrolase [Pseudonocardia humida]
MVVELLGAGEARVYARPADWPDVALVDTDVHITPRSIDALAGFLPARWRDYVRESGVQSLESDLYPPRSPLSAMPGTRPEDGPPGSDLDLLRAQLLDPWRTRIAVTHCVYGVDGIHNPDWAVAMARAVNDWQHAEWLAVEPRLRGSVVVAAQDPARAADEIDRVGPLPEFVQVLMPVRARAPLGSRTFWPIYEAAQRHGLALAVYAGGAAGNPVTPVGAPSYYLEEYVGLAQAFQAQVVSLVCEGVPVRFPRLPIVLVESGFTWLPALMWRLDKNWKGLRREVPWVDRLPSEVIRASVRLTAQPIDAPDPARLGDVLDRLGSDRMLMFATDYPHHQFDDPALAAPADLPPDAMARFLGGTAHETYRLGEG